MNTNYESLTLGGSMFKKISIFAFIAFLALNGAVLAKDNVGDDLKKTLQANFKAYQDENIDEVMKTVHSESPGYEATKEFSAQIFPAYDIKYDLVQFKYIAVEGEYALARVKQKTVKVSGPEFKDNIIDSIVIFKQEEGTWKLWSQATLTLEFI